MKKRIEPLKLNKNQVRQGDVFLIRVADNDAKSPEITQVQPGQSVILAHGEVTGHTHALRYDDGKIDQIVDPAQLPPPTSKYDASAERFIRALIPATMRHEEHTPVRIRDGVWESPVQVQAMPGNMVQRVAD